MSRRRAGLEIVAAPSSGWCDPATGTCSIGAGANADAAADADAKASTVEVEVEARDENTAGDVPGAARR